MRTGSMALRMQLREKNKETEKLSGRKLKGKQGWFCGKQAKEKVCGEMEKNQRNIQDFKAQTKGRRERKRKGKK